MQKASICINKGAILQGGKACKNPKITWTGSQETCLIINCEEDNCITVQIPEDCDDKCVTFIVECDDCDECPPQIITRCLCEDGECPPCFECIDGFCQPKPCPDGQFCDPITGDCVDCVADEDCPCNQVCVQGGCGCPPGTIENPITQCCVECLTADDCEGCDLCISGNCTPKDCTGGVLNPNTCNCQECLIADDCEGLNECCVGGNCVCCPGFIRNPQTGECEPIPPCTTDDDCPDCFICSPDGCIPQVCPDGRVCVDGVCEIECECPSGSCPPGRACTEIRPGVCICVPTNVICSGPCDTASDCDDPRCGCVNNECTFIGPPPSEPCVGPCSDGNDCAPGCGCFEGQCVPCNSVTCANGIIDCPEGCFCNDGVCDENPCADVYCENPDDCGVGCGCEDGKCVPCNSLDCVSTECADVPGCNCVGFNCQDSGPEDCEDEFFFEKGDCDLTLNMNTDNCCQCESMSIRQNLATTNVSALKDNYIIQNIRWFKDGVFLNDYLDLLNEYPTQHSVQYRIQDTYIQLNSQGVPTGNSQAVVMETATVTADLDPATATFTTPLVKPNVNVGNSDDNRIPYTFARLATRTVQIRTNIDFEFRSGCNYRISPWTDLIVFGSTSSIPSGNSSGPVVNAPMQRLVVCRTPVFNVFRNFNGPASTSGSPLFSVYADGANGSYSFNMDADLEVTLPNASTTRVVQYGAYYAATADCGCDKTAVYSCFGPQGAATPLVFCDPRPIVEGVDYEIDQCGERLIFLRDVPAICEVYTAAGNTKPVYRLLLNGQVVDTRTLGTAPSVGDNVYLTGNAFTLSPSGTKITNVRFEIDKDVCNDCTITNPINFQPLQVNFDAFAACNDVTNVDLTLSVSGGLAPYTIVIEKDGNEIVNEVQNNAGTFNYQTAFQNTTYEVTVTDSQGCEETRLITLNVGEALTGVTATLTCNGVQPVITVTNTTNEQVVADVEVGESSVGTIIVPANSTNTFNAQAATTYTLTIEGATSGCELVVNLGPITCCQNSVLNNAQVAYDCPNGVVFTSMPGSAIVGYRLQPSSGEYAELVAGQGLEPGTYDILLELGSCTIMLTLNVPQCYECVEDDCLEAVNNIGNFTNDDSCNLECGCQDEICRAQVLYASTRINSVRIDGVNIPVPTAPFLSCSGSTPEGAEAFEALMLTLLENNGECSIGSVSIDFECVPYDASKDPNGCQSEATTWVRVNIQNSSLNIEGFTDFGSGCFMPSEQDC